MKKTIICISIIILIAISWVFVMEMRSELPVYINKELPVINEGNYDSEGIIMYDYGIETGLQYNPLFIANDAISFYNDYHGCPSGYTPNSEYKRYFFKYVNWLIQNSEVRDDVGRILPYKFDSKLGGKAPWHSGITQARVAKVFSLAYEWTQEEKYLKYAEEVLSPVFIEIKDGGLLYSKDDIYFFEEYIHPPDHSLNGHMSVIKNLFEVNEILEDDKIEAWIDKGVSSLIKVLYLYEMPNQMAFADKSLEGGDFKKFKPSETLIRTYDRIHMHYFAHLYKRTGNNIFKEYFYKYYGMLSLKPIFKKNFNILSDDLNTEITESSLYFDSPNDLTTSFNNFRFDTNKYTAGKTLSQDEKEAFFVAELNNPKPIGEIAIQFRYSDYPQKFELQGFNEGKWHTIVSEKNYNKSSELNNAYNAYIYEYKGNEQFEKLRFSASDFVGQNRLLLGHFSIKEKISNKSLFDMWTNHLDSNVLKFIGRETLNNCFQEAGEYNLNKLLIEEFASKMNEEVDDFWSITRPIIDSLNTGEVEFKLRQ